jgi:hypothetical protein
MTTVRTAPGSISRKLEQSSGLSTALGRGALKLFDESPWKIATKTLEPWYSNPKKIPKKIENLQILRGHMIFTVLEIKCSIFRG